MKPDWIMSAADEVRDMARAHREARSGFGAVAFADWARYHWQRGAAIARAERGQP